MSFGTPHQAATWLVVTAGGAFVTADPTALESLGDVGSVSALALSSGLVGSAILDRLRGRGDEEDDDDVDDLLGGDGLDGGMGDDMGGMDGMEAPTNSNIASTNSKARSGASPRRSGRSAARTRR
jgi:hypothetical protein